MTVELPLWLVIWLPLGALIGWAVGTWIGDNW